MQGKAGLVAPHAGAWIEIIIPDIIKKSSFIVAPHAGAWIEIENDTTVKTMISTVAPHAGAWIEISSSGYMSGTVGVAPHAGAWIEIGGIFLTHMCILRRPPRGGVD